MSALRLLAALSAFPSQAHAGELFFIEAQSISPAVYETPEPVLTEVNSLSAALTLPLSVREGTWLVPGAAYRLEAPRFIEPPATLPPVPLLHDLELSLAVNHALGERWSVLARVQGGLAGDLKAIDRGVVRLGGLAVGTHHVNDRLDLGLGLAVSYAFGQLAPVPLLRVAWAPTETLSLDALLPAHLRLIWQPLDRWRFGLFGELDGNEYAIRDPDVAEAPPCVGEAADLDECLDHIAYTDGNLGLSAGVRLTGGLWLEARGGASLYRRFGLLNAQDEAVSYGEQRLPPSAFVKLRLAWVY